MEEPDFLDLHNFLANDIIRTREGGAGWMIDLALNADRCNPKTFLLKTKKCNGVGSIVLEPALSPENYINPKSESSGGFFGMFASKTSVSINQSLSEESVPTTIFSESSAVSQHKYACVKSTDATGTVRFRIAPNAGFGASLTGTKSTSSSVEVFCEDLVTKSVDFEGLRGALEEHTVNTSVTNISGENSLFVVTDVIVAGKISWEVKQNVESKKRGGGNVEVEPVNVEAGAGISSQRPEEHRQVVNNAVLALKFAKISYDDQGKIVGMDKSGNFEGNYTLGPGTEDRERQTAIMMVGGGENGRKGSHLTIRYIGQEKCDRGYRGPFQSYSHIHAERVCLQSILETGKHQEKFHEWMQLPLKGLVVTKEGSYRYRIPWKKKKKERIYLEKVSVTDVQGDNTFTCISNSQLDIPKRDSWVWLDCKQWRDSLTKNEIKVNVEFKGSTRTLTVDAEDPVIVIMHKMRDKVPCHKQVLQYKGTVIKHPADTIKDLGIKDGDQLTLELGQEGGSNMHNVLEIQFLQNASRSFYEKIISGSLQDIRDMGTKYPGLKMDEARVKKILQAELSEDEADISPKGFQQLMEALGKKVELDDILKAVDVHRLEDSSDEDDQFNVLDMMTSSIEGRSWFNDGDPDMGASNVDQKFRNALMNFRSLSIEEQEYMERESSDTEAEEGSSQDASHLEEGKLPRPPMRKTLPTVPGFSEAEVEEASKLLQGLFFKMKSEEPESAEKVSDVDWEAVNRRRMIWSDVQLSGLDDIAEGDKYKALRLLKRQMSGKDEEKGAYFISSVEEKGQIGPNLPHGVSSMDSSHGLEKFS